MEKEVTDMDGKDLPEDIQKAISGARINWSKSREEAWNELELRMHDKRPTARIIRMGRSRRLTAIAATAVVFLSIPVVAMLYTKNIRVAPGSQSEIYLPDKTFVRLNAETSLTYKPLYWMIARKVWLEGEAYFDVTKGRKFEVISNNGNTTVMGTSFDIYSREKEYQVTCISGRVRVSDNSGNHETFLGPGQQTSLSTEGGLKTATRIDTTQTISWIEGRFSFTSVPLKKVIEEIARQYGIKVILRSDSENIYTGTFKRDSSADYALNVVCRPFDLKAERKSENEYIISKSQ